MKILSLIIASTIFASAYKAEKVQISPTIDERPQTIATRLKDEKMSWEDAYELIPPKYNVPHELVLTLVQIESNGKINAQRVEHHLKPKIKRFVSSTPGNSAEEWASSWGPFQVLAIHAGKDGKHWKVLLEPEHGTEYAMRIFSRGLEHCRQNYPTNSLQYECAFRIWNGGKDKNASELAKKYSKKAMEVLKKYLVENRL